MTYRLKSDIPIIYGWLSPKVFPNDLRIIKNKVKLTCKCDSIIFYGHLLLRVSKTFSKFDLVFGHESCVSFWDFPFVEAPPNIIEFGDIRSYESSQVSESMKDVNPEKLT